MKLPSWSVVRLVLLACGLPFLAASVGVACLDYAGEEIEGCGETASSGSGNADGGLDAAAPAAEQDCGPPPVVGSGSGSAAP